MELIHVSSRVMDSDYAFRMIYHNHTTASNGTMNYKIHGKPASRTVLDSPQTPENLLNGALSMGAKVVFVSEHNRSDIRGVLEYRDNHEKFKDIQVYPGIEMSCSYERDDGKFNRNCHLLGLGVPNGQKYKAGDLPEEIAQKFESSGVVTIVPHGRGMTSSLLKEGFERVKRYVNVVEVFNSNNLDDYSNSGSFWDAYRSNKVGIAGSDAHEESALGLCDITMSGSTKLDDVLQNIEKGRFVVGGIKTTTISDMVRLYDYQISEPGLMYSSLREEYGVKGEYAAKIAVAAFHFLAKRYHHGSLSRSIIDTPANILLRSIRNMSKKLNVFDYPISVNEGSLKDRILETFRPLNPDMFGKDRIDLNIFEDPENPIVTSGMINRMNSRISKMNIEGLDRELY